MTKTLNTSVVTATPASYLGSRPIVLVEIELDSTTTLYFAEDSITIDARQYYGKVINMGTIMANIGAGLDNITIELENTESVDGTRVSSYVESHGLLKKKVSVYQYFTGEGLADRDLLFYGVINGSGTGISYNKNRLRFDVEDISSTYHKDIGLTYEQLGYTSAPDEIKQLMVPLVYGTQKSLKLNPVTKNVKGNLRFPVSATSTSIELTDNSPIEDFPTPLSGRPEYIKIGNEVIAYTSITENVLNVAITSVGTVSSVTKTSADNVVIGSGTTWLTTLEKGDFVKLSSDNDDWVQVKSVDGNTQLTIYGPWRSSSTSGTLQKSGRGRAYYCDDLAITVLDKTQPSIHDSGANVNLLRPVKFIGAVGTNRSNSNESDLPTITNLQTLDTEGTLKALPTRFSNGALGYLLPGRDLDNPQDPINIRRWDLETSYVMEGVEPQFIMGDHCMAGEDDNGDPEAFFIIGANSDLNTYQVYMYAPKIGTNTWQKIWDSSTVANYLDVGTSGITTYNGFGGITNFDKDGKVCWMVGYHASGRRMYIYDYTTATFSYKDCTLDATLNGELQYVFGLASSYKGDDSTATIRVNSVGSNAVSSSYPVILGIEGLNNASPTIYGDISSYLSGLRSSVYPTVKARSHIDWVDDVNVDSFGASYYSDYSSGSLRHHSAFVDSGGALNVTAPTTYTQSGIDAVGCVYDPFKRYASFNSYGVALGMSAAFGVMLANRTYNIKYSTTELYGQFHITVGNYNYKLRSSTTDAYGTLGDAVDFEKAYASCVFAVRGQDERLYVGLVADTDTTSVNVDVYALTSDTRVLGYGAYASGTGYITDSDSEFLSDVHEGDVVDIVELNITDYDASFTISASKTISNSDIASDTQLDMSGLGLSDGTSYLYRVRTGHTKKAEKVAQITLAKGDSVNDLYCQVITSGSDILVIPSYGADTNVFHYQRIPVPTKSSAAEESNVGVIFSHWPTVPQESTNYIAIEQAMDSGYDNSYDTANGVETVHYKVCGNKKQFFTDTNGQRMYHTVNVAAASDVTDERASKLVVRADQLGHAEGDFRLLTNRGTRVREAYIRVNYHAITDALMNGDTLRLSVSGSEFEVLSTSGSDYVRTTQSYVDLPMLEEAVPGSASSDAPITYSIKVFGITDIKDLLKRDVTLQWNGSSATSDILITEVAWDVVLYEDVETDVSNIYADITLATGDFYPSGQTQGSSTYDNYSDGINPVRVIHDIVEEGFEGSLRGAGKLADTLLYADTITEFGNTLYVVVKDSAADCDCYKSVDNGFTWDFAGEVKSGGVGSQITPYDLKADSAGALIAISGAGSNASVMRSVDKGVTWSEIGNSSSLTNLAGLNALHIIDTDTIIAIGVDSSGYSSSWKTEDTGISWSKIAVGASVTGTCTAIDADSDDNLYVVVYGATDYIYMSDDRGDTWSSIYSTASHNIECLKVLSDDTILYGAYNTSSTVANIYYSEDGGTTFTEGGELGTNIGVPNVVSELRQNVLAIGVYSGTSPDLLYLSYDNGLTWTSADQEMGLFETIQDIYVVSPDRIVFSGYDGSGVGKSIYVYDVPLNYGTLGLNYTSVIEQDSFTAASQRLKANNIKFNGAIVKRMNSKELLEKICYEARLHHWWDENGKLNVTYKESMADFSGLSVDRTIDADQVMDLLGPAITIPIKIFSKFNLRYDREKLSADSSENYTDEILRDVSYKRTFGLVDEGNIDTMFIADDNTAKKLVSQILDYNTTEYKLYSLECTLNELMVERMDIVETTNMFDNISKGYVQEIRRTFGKNRYFFTIRKVS